MLADENRTVETMPGPISHRHKSLMLKQGGRLKLWARLFNASLRLSWDMRVVYQFVLNRTLRFGKRIEEISESDFLNGVVRNRVMICPGVAISRTSLHMAIQRLLTRGALRRTVAGRHVYYELNVEWSDSDIEAIPLHPWDTDWVQLGALIEEDGAC